MLEWDDRSYTSDKALHSSYGQLDTSSINARNRFGAAFCHPITRGTIRRLLEGFCWYAGVNWGLRISCVNLWLLQHIMHEGLRCLQDPRSWYWRTSFLSTAIVIHETGVRQRCCARQTYHLRALWLKECYLGFESISKSITTKTNQRSLSQLVSLHSTTTNLT